MSTMGSEGDAQFALLRVVTLANALETSVHLTEYNQNSTPHQMERPDDGRKHALQGNDQLGELWRSWVSRIQAR